MQVGDTLGSYQILQEIGRGGMATVYRARQASMDRDVAIKVIQRGAKDADAAQRFQREARLIARLEHPHILPVYDFDGAHDPPYIVMRCLDGGTLEDVFSRGLPLPGEVAAIMRQVCSGLSYAHRQGVIHRDIKPSNILFDKDGNAFVSDFGIARLVTAPTSMRITQKGMVLGSVEYMSPEQVLGKTDLDHRSDLYSLGVMLFQLLTGRLPYVSDPPLGVLSMHVQSPVPSAVLFNAALPQAIDDVICKAMAKNHEQRYRSALELSAALDAALGGTSTASTPIVDDLPAQTAYLRELINIPVRAEGVFAPTPAPVEENRLMTAMYLNAAEYVEMVETAARAPGAARRHGRGQQETASGDPEKAHRMILNLWLTFESIVAEAGGEVLLRSDNDLLAVWCSGAPEEDAEQAVRTALALQTELHSRAAADLGEALDRKEWLEQIPLNVGIHSGMGLFSPNAQPDAKTGSYSVSGATISLTYRLMQAAFGCILITQEVYRNVRGVFEVQPDLPLRMRGRVEGMPTYRVTAAKPRAFRPSARVEWIETRMVGREVELKRLQHAFLNAIEDAETQVATISGAPGLGKSRLLDAFDQWCDLRPEMFYLFRGRATGTPERPYSLLRDLVAFRFQVRGDDPPDKVIEKLEQGIAGLVGEHDPDSSREMAHYIGHLCGFSLQDSPHIRPLAGDPANLDARSRAAFIELISILTRIDYVMIELEDLHLADEASLDLLEELFGALYASTDITHLMVACTARPELFERRPDWGRGKPYHIRLDLQPLDRRESRELVRELLQKAGSVPREMRDLLVEQSGGNPFHMEELVKMLIDDRVIVVEGDGWFIKEDRLGSLAVPKGLSGLLETRLETLLTPEKLVLERASVVGSVFFDCVLSRMDEAEVAAHGTAAHVTDLSAVLDTLTQREFINRHETSAFSGCAEYAFAQSLLRETVYGQLPEQQRRTGHRAVAEWLISLPRANEFLPQIAEHYEQAGAMGLAANTLRRAGERAFRRGLFREAEDLFERALARQPQGGQLAERLALLLGLGAAAEGRGNLPMAELALVEALGLAVDYGGAAVLARARYLMGLVETRKGNYTTAREQFDLALTQARLSGDDDVLANVLSGLAEACFRSGDIDNAFLTALECIDLAKTQENDSLLAAMQNRLAMVYWMHGEMDAAREQLDEALALARRIGLRRVEGAALSNLGLLAFNAYDWVDAVQWWKAGLDIQRDLGEISGVNIAACNLAVGYLRLGDVEKARPLISESLQAALRMDSVSGKLRAVLGWGEYRLAMGDTARGFALLGLTRFHPSSAADNVVAANLGAGFWKSVLRLSDAELDELLAEGKKLELNAIIDEMRQG